MTYATVVTTAQGIDNPIPHSYLVSPATPEGEPVEGMMGKFARINFAQGNLTGCNEADLIGIVMHRMAAVAQDGEHRNYERAIQALEAALEHLGEKLVVEEVSSDLEELAKAEGADLRHLAVESVQ